MKRIAAIILLLALLPLNASAYNPPEPVTAEELPEYVTVFINTYNSYADTFAVQPLPLDGWYNHDTYYSVYIGDVDFQIQEDSLGKMASLMIPPEKANLDFIASCACLSVAVRGFSPDVYISLMKTIIELRNTTKGENAKISLSNGLMIMTDREDLILFMVTQR